MKCHRLKGAGAPYSFEIRAGISGVGRHPGNSLQIEDSSVSSFHAQIELDEAGRLIVRDLHSTNGTTVDGSLIEETIVEADQLVQFGAVEFRLEVEEFEIRIPEVGKPASAKPAGVDRRLDDGRLACSRNPGLPATHEVIGACQAVLPCPGVFALASLRLARLKGGNAGTLLFCPDCNARCRAIGDADPNATRKRGILAKVSETIRLALR
jgi:pSer/pThr/pTyr-binding forkhead associated (FHA) protein